MHTLDNGQAHGSFEDRNEKLNELKYALRERVKELRCLYEISRLVESQGDSLADILQGIVDLIPASWEYPEICRVRMTVGDQEYVTADFKESSWKQSAVICVSGSPVGLLEVFLLRNTSRFADGPYLKAKHELIDAVAERSGKVVERIQTARQLDMDRNELREANTAFRRVLLQIEDEKEEWNKSILANVDKIIMPALLDLESSIPSHLREQVSLLKKQLGNLTSPFVNHISRRFADLTPAEIEICDMIREGFASKEIARMRHVSAATIAKQRERIRKKLRVDGTGTNLGTHLRMLTSYSSS